MTDSGGQPVVTAVEATTGATTDTTNQTTPVDASTGALGWIVVIVLILGVLLAVAILLARYLKKKREAKNLERGVKMVPMLIHLPPSTDDIQGGGRDERDVTNEALSQAQIMYSIIASTLKKGLKSKIYGQRHISFEMIVSDGLIKYYAVVPAVITETVKQAIVSAYPTARLEETYEDNIFSKEAGISGVAGGELSLQKEFVYPIATYEEMKWDASGTLINALSAAKEHEGIGLQLMFRPTDQSWTKKSEARVQKIREGNKKGGSGIWIIDKVTGIIRLPVEPMKEGLKNDEQEKPLTSVQQEEINAIEEKTRYPGFEVLIRVVASTNNRGRSEALVGGVISAFSQFNSQTNNSFAYAMSTDDQKLVKDYIFRIFPQRRSNMILNSMELATIFHLPSQNSIPNSQVERQLTKQVDGPAKLVTDGILLGVNEFRGQRKEIKLSEKDRRRHTYIIGATGMGKSVLLKNIAYQDMMAGRGFAFIDPHGDVTEELLSMVPEDRIDDVIYFDPGDIEHPIGMNMFEWETEDQKDFIVQEGINMLQSLYDPGNQGFFGPRGQHMFRNAALLLMSDPAGATFIDIPRCFIDPEFVKSKLQYVTDKSVYDYWTKEFPASQKSNDAGEVITWFASKWGPFLSNTMMKNILGQVNSGFNIRDIMDNKKILLVNLSKGKMGEINSKLLGMIFVMKFQTAAMSRVDTPEDQRNDFCLFVDEFQNFATESFESILSEARKFRLNLIVANQFMTQLTDKIREGLLGNVGTVICGRIGVTDAEIMEKVFTPVFNAEDLHNQPNFHAISTVMMFDMPSKPFTMSLIPPLSDGNPEVLDSMRAYSATKYGRTRAEVDAEINERLGSNSSTSDSSTAEDITLAAEKPEAFLDKWLSKKEELTGNDGTTGGTVTREVMGGATGGTPDGFAEGKTAGESVATGPRTEPNSTTPVFQDVIPDEDVEQAGGKKAEDMSMPDKDKDNASEDEVFKIR